MYSEHQAGPELTPFNPSRLEEQGVSIRDYVDLLIEGRSTIFKTFAIVMAITLAYLVLAPRTYKADGLLRIDKNKALLAAPLRSETNRAAEADNPRAQREVEILRSRSVLGKVVDDLNLVVEYSPRYFPFIGETFARLHDSDDGIAPSFMGLNQWAWGGEKLKITKFEVPERFLSKEFSLAALDAGRFRLLGPKDEILLEGPVGETLSAVIGRNNEPVEIRVTELKANPGTHFELSRITSLAAIETLQKAFTVREVSKDTDILSVELKGRDPEQLAQSVNDIASFYVNATVNWESAEAGQKLAFLESQMPIIKERLEKAEQNLSAYRQKHGAVDIPAEAEILLKQAAEMETMQIQLKQKYEQLNQRYEAAHPEMIATKAQIRSIENKLAHLSKRIKNLPQTQQQMVSLSRDVQVNTELYTSLLNSAQEQRIAAAGTLGNSRIIDYAVTPEKPYWPKPGLLLAIAALTGLTAGSALVFLRYSLQRHDNYPALLEYQVGLPLYAAIPHSKNQRRLGRLIEQGKDRKSGILVSHDPLDISVESLRSFRTNLETTLAGNESKVIMVGSPTPGMGKSFVSSNLAALLASIKKRVLIIDADLRNGRLHESFNIENQPGLSDLLAGKASLGEIIVSLPEVGVDFIPRGSLVINPAELLVLGNLEETLEQLKSFYNHIVIDSPPILAATDAAIIGKLVDATFLVVKEGRYTAHELEVSFRRFQQVGVKPNGFIINDLKEGSSYYQYYGYAYNQPVAKAKGLPLWTAGYHAMGGWFGKNNKEGILLATEMDAHSDERAEV